MEDIFENFPHYGKNIGDFSTLWKIIPRVFHGMENSMKRPVSGVAAAGVGTPSLAAQDRDAIDLAFILRMVARIRHSAVFRLFS